MSEHNLPFYVVNAFTSSMFGGNPAAVVPLETALDDDLLLDDEIKPELVGQHDAFVVNGNLLLTLKPQPGQGQFVTESFFVQRFD